MSSFLPKSNENPMKIALVGRSSPLKVGATQEEEMELCPINRLENANASEPVNKLETVNKGRM
jgi:hypothetical protein